MLFTLQYSNQVALLPITAIFVPKSNFCRWQKRCFTTFQKIKPTDQTIWFHAASLEYEQGPLINKRRISSYKISFFPSGYEVKTMQLLMYISH
jgi:3-deoxy-D-manno-octulosonic-acid transferase